MSEYGKGECIDCGQYGDRLLPDRFPHICRSCLFDDTRKESVSIAESPIEILPQTLLERLESFKSNGVFRQYDGGRGTGLSEKYNRRNDSG